MSGQGDTETSDTNAFTPHLPILCNARKQFYTGWIGPDLAAAWAAKSPFGWPSENLRSQFATQTLGKFFHLLQLLNQILRKHALLHIVDPGMNRLRQDDQFIGIALKLC